MRLLVVRVERPLKSALERLAVETARSISDIARDLILVGLDVQTRGGGVRLAGPAGLVMRPFATLGSLGEEETLSIWIGEELSGEVEEGFKTSLRGAVREALRLGLLRLRPEDVEVLGPFGIVSRPFATVTFPELSERANDALSRLSGSPERRKQ
jgi:hypothetical protein